jgi:hypothetical protein
MAILCFENLGASSFDRGVQSLLLKRLEKVVKGLRIEGAGGAAIVSAGKDDERTLRERHSTQDWKTIRTKQARIQQEQVGLVSLHCTNSFTTVAAFCQHLNSSFRFEHPPQTAARGQFVVSDDSADFWSHDSCLAQSERNLRRPTHIHMDAEERERVGHKVSLPGTVESTIGTCPR